MNWIKSVPRKGLLTLKYDDTKDPLSKPNWDLRRGLRPIRRRDADKSKFDSSTITADTDTTTEHAAVTTSTTSLIDITKFISLLPVNDDEETQLVDDMKNSPPKQTKYRVSKSMKEKLRAEDAKNEQRKQRRGNPKSLKRSAKPFY